MLLHYSIACVLCWRLRGECCFLVHSADGMMGENRRDLPSFLRWQSISSWSVCSLSWINGRVDGRNDSNQTTKLAVVVGSERTQIVMISHI